MKPAKVREQEQFRNDYPVLVFLLPQPPERGLTAPVGGKLDLDLPSIPMRKARITDHYQVRRTEDGVGKDGNCLRCKPFLHHYWICHHRRFAAIFLRMSGMSP